MTIKFHRHSGFYGDGNSRYFWEDRELDLSKGVMKIHTVVSKYGQLASNGNFQEDTEDEEIQAIPFNKETEEQIYEILLPLIETKEKYPHLVNFRFFSYKHKLFVTGRMNKAVKIAVKSGSHYYGTDCSKNIFVLQRKGLVVTTYYEDTFKHSFWKIKVEKI